MIPSDRALEVLDGMIEMSLINVASSAPASDIVRALDIKDVVDFSDWIRELLAGDYVRKRNPQSIRETVGYYVNTDRFSQLLKELDPDFEDSRPVTEPPWDEIKTDLRRLESLLDSSSLEQAKRAQAGAIISSLKILVEAPEPPKNVIRNLLYDLAAVATLFALAIEIADKIK